MTADDFRQGMRRLLGGVALITTREEDRPFGLIATAVTSVSAEPPRLLVCVNRTASSHDALQRAGLLCVNLLAQEHEPLARRFSSTQDREGRFALGRWDTMETGVPVLADALASFDCKVAEAIAAHSHTIFLCDIVGIRAGEVRAPLAYFNGAFVTAAPL